METRTDLSRLQRYDVDQVAAIAGRTFGRDLEPELVQRHARQAVLELVGDSAGLTAFLPELALRSMRDAVERRPMPIGQVGTGIAA
jgi:hypothetical protein